jgi:hypothetical protein
MSVQILQLEPKEQGEYVELRETVRAIMARECGLELLLNAIVATGPDFTRDTIERWVNGTHSYSLNDRDVAAFCYGPERLIDTPPIIDLSPSSGAAFYDNVGFEFG